MTELFKTLLTEPLYNLLILILGIIPYADLGVAVIILTIIVRFILFPLSKSAIQTQIKVKKIQEPLKELREKHKGNQQMLATEMMKLYKENNIKPFSGFFLLFLQLPVVFALYYVFLRGNFPEVNSEWIYAFNVFPEIVSVNFLGILNIAQKSIILALLVGLTQFIQAKISFSNQDKNNQKPKTNSKPSLSDDIMKSMQIQMIYVLPIIFAAVAYGLGGLIALYFLTGNIFSIFQQIYIQKQIERADKNNQNKDALEVEVVKN